jgi:uncharacterized membrane protein (UPF0127 family)
MIKIITPLILILGGIGLFFYLGTKTVKSKTAEINGKKLNIEIADTPAKRTKGLMFRDSLEDDSGMLFIFPSSAKYTLWMANTYIPLDMVWIDKNKSVVYMEENVPPCTEAQNIKEKCKRYTPDTPAKYILELNAGKASELNVKIGDKVNFNL